MDNPQTISAGALLGLHGTIKNLREEVRVLQFDLDKERQLRREAEDKDLQVRRNQELKTSIEAHQKAHREAIACARSGLAALENLYGGK